MCYLHAKVIGVTQPTIAVGLTERFSSGQEEKKKNPRTAKKGGKKARLKTLKMYCWCAPRVRESRRRITSGSVWACRCGSTVWAQAPASVPGTSSSSRSSAGAGRRRLSPAEHRRDRDMTSLTSDSSHSPDMIIQTFKPAPALLQNFWKTSNV